MTWTRLKGGHVTGDRRLDRLPSQDDRNRSFLLSAVLDDRPIIPKTWGLRGRLDQGQEGACVGFGWTHRVNAEPARHYYRAVTAQRIYHEAQKLDEWQGEDYEGTSVLAGAKAWRARGRINAFRWAYDLDTILRAVSYEGPVVMGTVWLSGMFDPDAKGVLNVTGSQVGGHCWLIRGVDPTHERVRLTNSWGPDWGIGGDAWMSYAGLTKLLREDGEACAPTES